MIMDLIRDIWIKSFDFEGTRSEQILSYFCFLGFISVAFCWPVTCVITTGVRIFLCISFRNLSSKTHPPPQVPLQKLQRGRLTCLTLAMPQLVLTLQLQVSANDKRPGNILRLISSMYWPSGRLRVLNCQCVLSSLQCTAV